MHRRLRQAVAAVWLAAGFSVGSGAIHPAPAQTRHQQTSASSSVPMPHAVHSRATPLKTARTALVPFDTAPFPFSGEMPHAGRNFFDVVDGERRGHRTGGGRIYWEDETYSDNRVLLHIPQGFDVRRPSLIIVYFHGHGGTLDDIAKRQKIPAQLSHSGVNAVLVAPQLAVAAADSSIGKLWRPGAFARFLGEAARELAKLHGDPKSAKSFAGLPVVVVGYSGGYLATAWSLKQGGIGKRLRGVVLFDAMYGEMDTFERWIERDRSAFFVSSFTSSTRSRNLQLGRTLAARDIPVAGDLTGRMRPGSVSLLEGQTDATHRDFLTYAWTEAPLKDVLVRLAGYQKPVPSPKPATRPKLSGSSAPRR